MSRNLSPTAAKLWDHLSALAATYDGRPVHVTYDDVAETFAWPMGTVRSAIDELVAAGNLFEDQDGRIWRQS